jgi:predicted nuclease of predicted toxin-antitoxin system
MLRLLLDQMLDADIATALQQQQYDVVRVSEVGLSRANDQQVLQKAIQTKRILITLDEHFGDWAVLPLSDHPGVIRIKANPAITKTILSVLLPFLRNHGNKIFTNRLVIVGSKRVRWIST